MSPSTTDGRTAILRSGDHWVLVYGGATCRRPDGGGIGCLAALMQQPHETISALILERQAPPLESPCRTALHDARERARLRVGEAVAAEIAAIAGECPALARHLLEAIRIGEFCVYAPSDEGASQLVGSLGSGAQAAGLRSI